MGTASPLSVFVEGADIPVAGAMRTHDGQPVFLPSFPLASGLAYRVKASSGCEATFEVVARSKTRPSGRPVEVFPTAETLPENILRFYVYFAQPMAEGRFLDYVRLTDVASGEDMTGVFFDNVYELWSNDRKRITLLVDPGRVKTGLRMHALQGRAFKAGRTYALHIDARWPTLSGSPMRQGLTKVFRAMGEDRRRVEPRRWRLNVPKAGTLKPLLVDFIEPVDHVSVSHFVKVIGPHGGQLEGVWRLEPKETRAAWTPRRPWSGRIEAHRLVVHGRFEDIAGNNVNGAFDHRVGDLAAGGEDRWLQIPFGEL